MFEIFLENVRRCGSLRGLSRMGEVLKRFVAIMAAEENVDNGKYKVCVGGDIIVSPIRVLNSIIIILTI